MDKIPSSFEYCLVLFSSALEFKDKEKIIMNNLIIDAANKKIFFMLIKNKNIYSVSHENSKTNYEKLIILINDFLRDYNLKISEISRLYVNRGPGNYSSIRISIATIKALKLVNSFDLYGFKTEDVINENYDKIIDLFNNGHLKKNLIKPYYSS